MNQILLVDDDAISRARIRGMLDWEAHGLQIAWEARNGREAIEMLTHAYPDLVLTDVNMPIVDGVALVQHIGQHHLEIPVVVLSAYDDFDYVRSCLKNGATDYLLKHDLDKQNLLSVITAAIRKKPVLGFKHSLHRDAAEFVALAVSGWFASPDELEAYAQLLHADMLPETYYPVVGMPSDANVLLSQQMFGMMQEVAATWRCTVFRVAQNRLFLMFPASGEKWDEEPLMEMLRNALDSFERIFEVSFSFGVGDLCRGVRSLASGYQQACERHSAMARSGVRGFAAWRKENEEVSAHTLTIEESSQLKACIASGNGQQIRRAVHALFDRLGEVAFDSDADRFIYADLVQVLLQCAGERPMEPFPPFSSFGSTQELRDWFAQSAVRLSAAEGEAPKPSYSEYTLKAIEYLRAHYSQHISLRDVAGHLNLNASYLSRLFSAETGDTLTAYLTQLRMDQAERLLMEPGLSIKEIADSIGISNYSHFSTTFKRIKGVTPNEFRQKME